MCCLSADTPDASGDLEQVLDVNSVAEEPGKDGTAAATEPEPTGEVGPAGAGEQVSRGISTVTSAGGMLGCFPGWL